MPIQKVNIGSLPNDGTGDVLRGAFKKINDNFDQILEGSIGLPEATADGQMIIYNQLDDIWTANNTVRNVNLRQYGEKFLSSTVNTSAWTLSCAVYNMHILNLQNSITTLNITNVPTENNTSFTLTLLFPDTQGYFVAWPPNIKWREGRLPEFSSTVGSVNIVVLTTYDKGVSWLGTPANNYRTAL